MNNSLATLARLLLGVAAMLAIAAPSPARDPPVEAQVHPPVAPLPTMARGFRVEVYASVPTPEKLSFGDDGSLYVGQPGGVDHIYRITPNGRRAEPFGPVQQDPDAVLADNNGLIGGHRHSVLVGGGGILAAIYRNQQSAVIFNSGFSDVDDMQFDHQGRLVFSDDEPQVLASTGGPPTRLFATPGRPGSIAIDGADRIFVALDDGTIRVYRRDGAALGVFARGLAEGLNTYIAFDDPRTRFGPHDRYDRYDRFRFLYVLSGSTLLRIGAGGRVAVIGTGFDVGDASGTGMTFGPDHKLYISDYQANRVLRIFRPDDR